MHTTYEDLPAARELVRIVEAHATFLTSPRSQLRRHVAAAGLARCCALVDSMCVVAESGRTDTLGVLLRNTFEFWALSSYVLLKGKDPDDDEVLLQVGAENARWTQTLINKLGLTELQEGMDERKEILAERGVEPKDIRWDVLAGELDALLTDPGQECAYLGTKAYNHIYRVESTYGGSHANLGGLNAYIWYGGEGERDSIVFRPETTFPNQLRLAALLTLGLARRVFRAFGVVVKPSLDNFEAQFSGVQAA